MFSVPLDVEPMVLHYRTDLFERYGLTVPRTWDDFEDAARTVRDKSDDRRLALFPTDGDNHVAAFAWQAGAQWFDTSGGAWNVSLADAPTRRVAAYWQRLTDHDLVFMNAVESRRQRCPDRQRPRAQPVQRRVGRRCPDEGQAGAEGPVGHRAVPPVGSGRPRCRDAWRLDLRGDEELRAPGGRDGVHRVAGLASGRAAGRLSSGASSQYPAAPGLVDVGRQAFDRSYYGGQDIYSLFEQEAHKIRPGWTWGPRMTATGRIMKDGLARASGGQGSILGAVRAAQEGTMPDLKALGLSTTQRST